MRAIKKSGYIFVAILCSGDALSQEICGLRDARFDRLFSDGFDPLSEFEMGPPEEMVEIPALGITPNLKITYPPQGAVLSKGKIQVLGTIEGSLNTGVSVSGLRAYIQGDSFMTPPFYVDSDVGSLEVTATTMDGITTTTSIDVSVSELPAEVNFWSDNPVGFSPLPVRFKIGLPGTIQSGSVALDFDGDGIIDYAGGIASEIPIFNYSSPGVYLAVAHIAIDGAQPIPMTTNVMVLSFTEQRQLLCGVYAYLRDGIIRKDPASAVHALTKLTRNRLGPLIHAFGDTAPVIASKLGILADGVIGIDNAEIISVRDHEGSLRGYSVRFQRDHDGVWRIVSM